MLCNRKHTSVRDLERIAWRFQKIHLIVTLDRKKKHKEINRSVTNFKKTQTIKKQNENGTKLENWSNRKNNSSVSKFEKKGQKTVEHNKVLNM